MCKQYFLLVISYIIYITSAATPSYIRKCKAEDSKCIKDSSNAAIPIFALGLPEFKVPVLDPSTINKLNARQGGLLFELTNVTVTGLRNCETQQVEGRLAKSKLYVKLACSIEAKGDFKYDVEGKLVVLPYEGVREQPITIELKPVFVDIDIDLIDEEDEDDQNHWQIKSWTHNFELKEKSDVVFEQFYGGNKILGRAARELFANNRNDIMMAIGNSVIDALGSKIVKAINQLFKAFPSSDFTLDN